MKKYVLWPLLAAIGGVGAFLLRLLQRSTGFEVDTGLPIPGNLYAILLVACSHLVPPHWQPALLGIGLGGVSHVVLDMLTPSGIPLHPFSRKNKLSFKVCSTGSVGEYVFLGVMLVLLGFLLGPEMKELIRHVRQLGMPVLHF